MYKRASRWISPKIKIICDSGFQGIKDLHANSEHPQKKGRKKKLDKETKDKNKEISKKRMPIEHINCRLKRFKILSYSYRGRRKKHLLRASLIAAFVNQNAG